MSGPPSFSNVAWCASSDFPSERHIAPPPGVSSSSPVPGAPPDTPSFVWSSAMTMPASGYSPGVFVGMHPLHSPLNHTNAHAWPLLSSSNSPQGVEGVYPQHPLVNADVSAQTFASYGVPNSNFGTHTSSYGTHTTSLGIRTISYGGTQDTSHNAQYHSYGGQIMNFESVSHNIMGSLDSSNAPSMQNSSSMLQPSTESNPSHASDVAQLKKMDAKSLLVNIKGLIAQANEAVQKVASLVNIKLSILPGKSLNPQTKVDGVGLYIKTDNDSKHTSSFEGSHRSDDSMTAKMVFNDMLKSLKGHDLFYKDAPGVVQVPVFTDDERVDSSTLPDFAKGERWAELTSRNIWEGDAPSRSADAQGKLLPSRFWLLRKEVSMWKGLPSKYTSSLLQAAAGLTMVKEADLQRWLFMHASLYGVAYSRSLANHIVVLLVFCLRAVYREATTVAASQEETGLIECRVLSESAYWLSSQLSMLYGPVASKNLVLGLFKFALETAAYCITFSQRGSIEGLPEEESSKVECVKVVCINPEQKLQNQTCMTSEIWSDKLIGSSCVGDEVLHLQHLAAAVLAIQAQGTLIKCKTCDSTAFQTSSSQRSAVHNMINKRAEEVRATRADFRAVLEHDGLLWQRTQNQESKKNKTKEEILAEERDYKRRRTSYRGKKVQRTPSEVLRDIIEGHMEEIVAAGGIGSFCRIPQDMQLPQSESELSALGTKDRSDAARTVRSSRRDVEGKETGTSYSTYSRYSRPESRGSHRTDRGDRHRSISVSLSSSSQRDNSPYRMRYERPSHDHSAAKSYEREYESNTEDSRWKSKLEDRERSIGYHGGKHYPSRCDSRDRSKSPM